MATLHPPRASEGARATIREMRADDLDAIVQLDARVSGDARRAYFERRLASLSPDHLDNHTLGLVAEVGGVIVGFVMGTLTHGEFGFTEITALVDSIVVHPDQRRRGIGQQLAGAFVAEGAARGVHDVYTLVNWNAWDMLKFFDSIGFSLTQTVPLRLHIGESQQSQQSQRETHEPD